MRRRITLAVAVGLSFVVAKATGTVPLASGRIIEPAKVQNTGEVVGEVAVEAYLDSAGHLTGELSIECTKEPSAKEMLKVVAQGVEVILSDATGSRLWTWSLPLTPWPDQVIGKGKVARTWVSPIKCPEYLFEKAAKIYPNFSPRVYPLIPPGSDYRFTWRGCEPSAINVATGASLVVILPGITGMDGNLNNAKGWIEEFDAGDGAPAVRVWDWTADRRIPELFPLQGRLEIRDHMQAVATDLAKYLMDWQAKAGNAHKRITLVGLSGGATMAALVCGSRSPNGGGFLLAEDFFDKVVFLSGALDVNDEHLLENTARAAKGVYNYLSYNDEILTASSFVEFLFFIPIPTHGHVRWVALGRFGVHHNHPNFKFITSQLCWLDDIYEGGLELGNDGKHLSPGCLARDYFKHFVLPLFHKDTRRIPGPTPITQQGWSQRLHKLYEQDQRSAELDPLRDKLTRTPPPRN